MSKNKVDPLFSQFVHRFNYLLLRMNVLFYYKIHVKFIFDSQKAFVSFFFPILSFNWSFCQHSDLLNFLLFICLDTAKKGRSEEHTSELQSRFDLVCRLLLEKKK